MKKKIIRKRTPRGLSPLAVETHATAYFEYQDKLRTHTPCGNDGCWQKRTYGT